MVHGSSSWISKGAFGRATLRFAQRAVVEHAHGELELIFKLGGADVQYKVGATHVSLDDDTLLILNPWTPHAKLPNKSGTTTTIVSILIESSWLAQVMSPAVPPFSDMFHRMQERMFARAQERMTDAVRADASRFAAAMTLHATHQASACEEAAAALLRRVVLTYSKMGAGARGVPEDARPSDYRIRKALPLIDAQALESPRIGEIAKQVGLSRSRFFEQFRRCVGVSPQHYVNVVRMSAATEWLSMTDRPLVELAEDLGFCAQSNFTRFFTQHTGVSPSEFRRQTRQFEPPAGADLVRSRATETRLVA